MPGYSAAAARPVRPGKTVTVYNNSTGALSAGDIVYWSTGTLTAAADSMRAAIAGIVVDDAARYAQVALYVEGVFNITCASSVNFAQGGAVYMASASTVDTGSALDIPIGHVVTTDPADGAANVDVLITTIYEDRTACS